MPKGKDIRHEGEFFSSTVAREQRICPGEDKANFISILQLLAALSEALRLLKNSEQLLFIHMHLSWTTRKPKANTNTPHIPAPARQLSCCSRTLDVPEQVCGGDSRAWKMGGIGSL